MKILKILLLVLVAVGIACGGWYWWVNRSEPLPNKDFVSEKLGVAFNYLPHPDNPYKSFNQVEEVGNRVYVGAGDLEDRQFVEVFRKDKNQTLEEAFKNTVLKGAYPDCVVTVYKDEDYGGFITSQMTTPGDYLFISMDYDGDKLSQEDIEIRDSDEVFGNFSLLSKKCGPYSGSNGLSYFLYDKNYPDRFFFFSIGQYGINDRQGNLWQYTFQVIKAR